MAQFKWSEKTIGLMVEVSNGYHAIVEELNDKEKSGVVLNSAELKLRQDIILVWEMQRLQTIELMLDSEYTWTQITAKLNLTHEQVKNLINYASSSDKKHFVATRFLPQRSTNPLNKIEDALKQLNVVGEKVATAIETVEEYSRNLEVYEDTEEVVNALAGIYNDASLDDCVDKYALGEAITHLRGLYEVAVDFSTKMNTALDIDTKQEDNEAEE